MKEAAFTEFATPKKEDIHSEGFGLSTVRSVYRSVVFIALLLAAVVDGQARKTFCGMRVGPAGAVWVSTWCRRIMRAMGLACSVEGPLPEAGAGALAVVSNHLSYLDILVMSATRPFVMVSKAEVKRWPLLGWITAQAGTVYVQRADVKGGQTQTHAEVNGMMAEAFASGLPVLFYPEGTTSSGETVLPFRRGLFNSVVHDHVPVKAVALAYELHPGNVGASVSEHVCFVGDADFGPHLFKALGLRGLSVRVKFGAEAVPGNDRFELARNSRDAVCELYEKISGATEIERQVDFPAQRPFIADTGHESIRSRSDEVALG
jgi:1-acyl-sn-glycerol-3-phosphate acyltransferase